MSETSQLPLVGAAMPSSKLADHRDWIIAEQRDLEIQDPAWPNIFDGDWQGVTRTIKSLLDGYTGRLGVHGPFWGLPLFAPDRKIREAVADRLKSALDFCAEIGGSHMVIHSPFQFLGNPYAPLLPSATFDPVEVIHETLREAVAQAEQLGCTLVIETIWDYDPTVWLGLVQSFNSPAVRASIDVGHVFVMHKQNSAPPPDYWVRHASDLLGHVHIQDSDGYSDRHWVPGDGEINFWAIFDALKKTGASPRLIIEVADHSRIQDAARWLIARGVAR